MVTDRLTPLRIEGRVLHQVWLPYHWGAGGLVTGDSANDLFGISLDPNVLIQESKVGHLRRPGRPPAHRARRCWSSSPATSAGPGVHDDHHVPIVTAGPGQESQGHGEP